MGSIEGYKDNVGTCDGNIVGTMDGSDDGSSAMIVGNTVARPSPSPSSSARTFLPMEVTSNSRSSTIVQFLDQSCNESISRRVLARLGLLDMLFLPPLLLPLAPPLLLPLQPLLGCSCWHVMVDRVVGAAEVQTMVWRVGVFPLLVLGDEPNQRHKIREEKNVQTHTHSHTHTLRVISMG